MIRAALLVAAIGAALGGCSNGADVTVSPDEEKMFKNPPPVDRSKISPDAFQPKGPAFIGEPSKGSGAGSAPPPAASTTG